MGMPAIPFLTAAATEALPAVAAPSILGGGLTGAGMMTSSQLPGLMASSTPGLMGGLGALGAGALDYAKANPFQTVGLGLNIYDRMNAQPQPIQAQPGQLIRNQSTLQYQPVLQTRIPQSAYPRKLY
jgi:hypothetical protein